MKKNTLSLLLGFSGLLLGSASFADPQHYPAAAPDDQITGSLWRVTAYGDTSPVQASTATQDICLIQEPVEGTNTTGIWFSTTFNEWTGRWRQEGDQVFLIGNFFQETGNDSMSWEIAGGETEAYGHWEEWVEDGGFGAWYFKSNTKAIKVGTCSIAVASPLLSTTSTAKTSTLSTTASVQKINLANVPTLVQTQASKAPVRLRTDGRPATPADPKAVPLR